MSKDVIIDRYARLYEIPYQLAKLGHEVHAFCASYQRDAEEGSWQHRSEPGTLIWQSRNVTNPWRVLAYPRTLLHELEDFRPDIVIAASDIPHVVVGAWLAKKLAAPFVVDLYDNFEGFGQARIPGMVPALRRAVRSADLVVTTSSPLRDLVVERYRARGRVIAMPSSIDGAVFHPGDRALARKHLALDGSAQLIGTAGGLYRDKGVAALYDAWNLLKLEFPTLQLVLAGPCERAFTPPAEERVKYLGPIAHAQVATMFCALDVGVICILDTPFGRYCFPQKAYEMLACGLPVVASDVGAMHALLQESPQSLFRTNDAHDLAEKIRRQLKEPQLPKILIEDWQQITSRLEKLLRDLVSAH